MAIFSTAEEKRLQAFRELMRRPEVFVDAYHERVLVTDTYTLVMPETTPTYHADADCPRMTAPYRNYYIPEPVRARGTPEVERFRAWFRMHEDLLCNPETEDRFYVTMAAAFDLKVSCLSKIDLANSGPVSFENMDLADLEAAIREFLRGAEDFYMSSWRNQRVLDQYMKHTCLVRSRAPLIHNRTGLPEAEVYKVLEAFLIQFKQPIYRMLVQYYRIAYNPELSFDGRLLDQLGFHCCGACGRYAGRSPCSIRIPAIPCDAFHELRQAS